MFIFLKWLTLIFLILFILHYSFYFSEKNIFWLVVNSISTILIFFTTFQYTNYTKSILEKSNKIAEYQLINDINKRFNEANFEKIYFIVLKEKVNLIDENEVENYIQFNLRKSTIKNTLIDLIEDTAIAIKLNLITYSTIDRYHGYDILKLGSSQLVRDVIIHYRTLHNNSVYNGFIDLYDTIYYKFLPQVEWKDYKEPFVKRNKIYCFYIRVVNCVKFLIQSFLK